MRIMNRTRTIAVLALGLMFAVGCSSLPTQPTDQQSTASGALRGRQIDAIPEDVTPPPPTTLVAGASNSVRVIGAIGGTVTAGKFTVIIPPGAFSGLATITVSQPDASQLACDLDITPANKNGFKIPVLLVADASSLPREVLSRSTMQWWDPAKSKWVTVPGASVSLLNLTVQAPLWHFSSYRVQGRAGW